MGSMFRPAAHSRSRQQGSFGFMSPRQAPRDLRASDADRDRVLVLLAEAVSDGRLTMEEHAERVQRACTARTLGELADLTADLVVASAQPVRLDGGRVISGIFGPARRDGRWVVPETLTVTALGGEVEVDFTQAILQTRHVQLLATVIGGRLRLVVPDGVSVAVNAHVMVGRRRGGTPPLAASDAPLIEVKGVVLGGEIIVRTPPRPRRRLFGRRRPPISRT
jgi:hypothetical protein